MALAAEAAAVDILRAERDAAVVRAEAAEAERTTERAITVAWLRSRAEAGDDPWMMHVADEVEAGLHVVMHDF